MPRLSFGPRRVTWLLGLVLACLVFAFFGGLGSEDAGLVGARPLAQMTCAPISCAWQRVYGYQPRRFETVRPLFNAAASNSLGSGAAPTYTPIAHDLPPAFGGPGVTYEEVSPARPIPHIVLRGMGWQESRWKQFANDKDSDPDDDSFCTLREEGGRCGCGLMQLTWCMTYPSDCPWLDLGRAAGELTYNLGGGTNWLISRWNWMSTPTYRLIGGNDHTVPADWYYAVTAYNGWSPDNDPNSWNSMRPPYDEKDYSDYGYPYQEIIWGWMAHPEKAQPLPTPPPDWRWLWRPTRIPWVPRGIWGLSLSDTWKPPEWSPQPVFHLLRDIHVSGGDGPALVLRNTTGSTLAADVALYNNDHTFNRWWLGAPYPPDPPLKYIRLGPYADLLVAVPDAFWRTETFDGYIRIAASAGLEVERRSLYRVFLPVAFKNYNAMTISSGYQEVIQNGGFEALENGRPQDWIVSSADGYPLADGTWFHDGHYGAYLGGYDDPEGIGDVDDSLVQGVTIPPNPQYANLCYDWYILSNWDFHYDELHIYLKRGSDIVASETLDDWSDSNAWRTTCFDNLTVHSGEFLRLSFEADMSTDYPAQFFVDNVSLGVITE